MKRILLLLALSCAQLFAQTNNARMLNGVNPVTSSTYTFTSVDSTRLTSFCNVGGIAVTLPSGLTQGFGAGTIFSAQNSCAGTVTITCSGCTITSNGAPAATLVLTSGAGADIYGDNLDANYTAQTGSGTGGGGGAVSSVFARTGGITATNTDYGTVGIQQVGSGTLNITSNTNGTLNLGNGSNTIVVSPTSSNNGMAFIDRFGNGIGLNGNGAVGSGGNYIQITTGPSIGSTATMNLSGGGGGEAQWTIGVSEVMSLKPALIEMDQTVDFGDTGSPFTIGGSAGLAGQCVVTDGSTVSFGSCATGTVGSVGVTANQTVNTGSAGSPVVGLFGGTGGTPSSPLIFPGNISGTQVANGDDFLTCTRKTDTSPTGNCFKSKTAGGTTTGIWDAAGNATLNTVTTNQAFSGYTGYAAATDGAATCLAALAALGFTGNCEVGNSTVGTSWANRRETAGPAAFSVEGFAALSSSVSQKSYVPTTDSSAPTFIQTGVASAASAANNALACFDGGGNTKDCGLTTSQVGFTSIIGPAVAYTNATTSGTTAFSYTPSIPAGSIIQIDCTGSYKFTTAAEQAEFGLNLSQTPQSIFLNVEIGANATTQTHTYGRQTSNGVLITSPTTAAATGTYYPVSIKGAVLTHASNASTFTIQAATSSASGTINVDASSFVCSVK